MPATCQPCGKPVKDTTICAVCGRALDAALIAAISLGPDLDIALARLARFTTGQRGGSGREQPLPFDDRASVAARRLRLALDRWVQAIRQPAEPWPAPRVDSRAVWLLARSEQLRRHDLGAQIHAEIVAAVDRATRVIDRPPDRVYAGPCTRCGADLIANPGETTIACRTCRAEHVIADRQAQLRADLEDMTGSPRWCAGMARALGWPLTDAAVGMWATRRKLAPTLAGGYRLGDVLDLAAARDTRSALTV